MNAIFSVHSSNTQEQVFFFILSVFVHRLSSHSESLPKSKLMKKKRPKACWHLVTGSLSSPGTAFDSQFVRNMSDDLSFCARWLNKLDITSCEENTRKFDVEMIFQWEDFSSSICLYSTLEHKKNVKKIHSLGACVSCVGAHTHKQHTHTSWSGSHASSTRVILPSPLCTLRQSQSTFSDPSYHFVHKLSGDKSYTEKCVISWMRRIHLNSYRVLYAPQH